MNDQTDRSDHGEQNKARRKGAGGRVVNDQPKKVDANQRRQFGLAGVTLTEGVGNLDNVQTAARPKDHIDQDLKSICGEAWSNLETISRKIVKKPLMGSVTVAPPISRKNHAPRSLSFWRAGERLPSFAS